MSFLIEHTTIQFDIWALLALILLAAVVIYLIVRHVKSKKAEDELQKEIKELTGEDEKAATDAAGTGTSV